MRVLISDRLSESGLKLLRAVFEVDVKTELSQEQLIEQIGNYDALVIRSATKVTSEVLNAAKALKVIGRAGVGIDNIDLATATEKGILVLNTPGGNTIAAAEHTISMMLALSRHIYLAGANLKSGNWSRRKFVGNELYRKTLGVIGVGKIGSEVIKRMRSFHMKIIAVDPYISSKIADKLGIELVSREELFKRSDYISLHLPLIAETRNSIGEAEFELMKSDCRLINCARGGIVDETALYHALKNRQIAGAALDVFEEEPPRNRQLIELDNCLVTPHLGASTREAQDKVAVVVAEQLINALKNLPVENAVNMPKVDRPEALRPYVALAELMGSFQSQIVEGQISEIKIEYCGDLFDNSLPLVSVAVQTGLLKNVLQAEVNYVNAPFLMRQRGIKVSETRIDHKHHDVSFSNSIAVTVVTDQGERTVEGTSIGTDDIRIVRIDDLHLNAKPKGHMLLISNQDQPGIIGLLGTILGDNEINIADMTVGRKGISSHAVTLISVDSSVPRHVLRELEENDRIRFVRQIKL